VQVPGVIIGAKMEKKYIKKIQELQKKMILVLRWHI